MLYAILVRIHASARFNQFSDCAFQGFFYVKNFNISQEEVDRQFALGREFYSLPLEEKLKYHSRADLDRGEYNGYRPAGHRK